MAETFAGTVQGEGPSTGSPAAFVRLSRCNLTCLPWCDTPYTWDTSRFDLARESRRMSVADVLAWTLPQPEELVVITGGEPLLQQHAVILLAQALADSGKRVEIETNGTYLPSRKLIAAGAHFNVSPKLSNSTMPYARRIRPRALEAFAAAPHRAFKFVACEVGDLEEIDELVARHGLSPVWVMPQGTTAQAVIDGMRALAPEVVARGYRLSTRLHVLMWGDERGR
ncbi:MULTISPECIES: 7-carboxy-7-deazaguanine synthase QueE [Streptomyces]|uniref:7-carboxy-7-deazaguanine synthase QueE n=1 Tax=Streptomyces TaxID=1883 RepID=UPI001CCA7E58|nr:MULTISPECIES: 7-carboxy-7-deazaguanine synthase QueE [Streptomyces]UBI40082.1 7-carboxy-7-deazaguanine synthase QueE [Streptomyces mobaraensis]UKW32661.1 7-carboxy-7-deazaguanine synthase QueE [Streptomyces sp. TYQ1024]